MEGSFELNSVLQYGSYAAFVYRLGHDPFTVGKGVRFFYVVPKLHGELAERLIAPD